MSKLRRIGSKTIDKYANELFAADFAFFPALKASIGAEFASRRTCGRSRLLARRRCLLLRSVSSMAGYPLDLA
jgi:hypothetical protein